MNYVFISYSRADEKFVENLVNRLSETTKVYWDKWEIEAGDPLVEKLSMGVQQSSWFVIIATKNSMQSRWVKYEMQMAIIKWIEDKNYRIIVVKIDDCEIPLALKPFVYIDCSKNPGLAIEQLIKLIQNRGEGILPQRKWSKTIVDRFLELRQIERAFYEGCRFIFLCGLYGIGKTTLAEYAAKQIFNAELATFTLTQSHDYLRIALELSSRANLELPEPSSSKEKLIDVSVEAIKKLIEKGYIVFFDNVENAMEEDHSLKDYLSDILERLTSYLPVPIFLSSNYYHPIVKQSIEKLADYKKIGPLETDDLVNMLLNWIKLTDASKKIEIEKEKLKEAAQHLFGYPLAARFAAYLIAKYSIEVVLEDLQYFTNLRVDIAKQLLGSIQTNLSNDEIKVLEILTMADSGLDLDVIAYSLEMDIDDAKRIIDNLSSNMLVFFDGTKLQILPLIKDYFERRMNQMNTWKNYASKLANEAKFKLAQVKINSIDYVHYSILAYRMLLLSNRIDQARQLKYQFNAAFREVALKLYNAKEYDRALEYCNACLEFNEKDYRIRLLRARCLTRLNKLEEAEKELKKLDNLNFMKDKIYHAWGLLYKSKRDLKTAAYYFKKALQYRSDNAAILRDLGDALYHLGEIDEAFKYISKGYEVAPRDPYILPKYVDILAKKGNENEAMQILNEALKVFPDMPIFNHQKALLLKSQGDYSKAIEFAEKAVRFDPKLVEAKITLASLLIKIDEIEKAKDLIYSLPDKLPKYVEPVRDTVLAEIQLKENNVELAEKILLKYRDSPDPFIAEIFIKIDIQKALYYFGENQYDKVRQLLERANLKCGRFLKKFPKHYFLIEKHIETIKKMENELSP